MWGQSHRITYRQKETSGTGFAVEWSERQRGAGFILFPVIGNEVTRQKSRQSRDLRVEIFRV
ncbi:hypothetical protein I5Q83_25105 [Enterocloster clostridioformis]|nr:hypothetical protein [Enterocloster clostridioformis]QQQ99242.1 hypothetical protein I5Q83_25105 [Enterocloster clostridioformis]